MNARIVADAQKVLYQAPEVLVSDSGTIGTASDIWSLAVTVYMVTTGTMPFETKESILNSEISWQRTTDKGIRLSQQFK